MASLAEFYCSLIIRALHTSSKVPYISDHSQKIWNLKAMALDACVQAVTPIYLKIPSNLLHMELTRTQVHKYDFSNCDG